MAGIPAPEHEFRLVGVTGVAIAGVCIAASGQTGEGHHRGQSRKNLLRVTHVSSFESQHQTVFVRYDQEPHPTLPPVLIYRCTNDDDSRYALLRTALGLLLFDSVSFLIQLCIIDSYDTRLYQHVKSGRTSPFRYPLVNRLTLDFPGVSHSLRDRRLSYSRILRHLTDRKFQPHPKQALILRIHQSRKHHSDAARPTAHDPLKTGSPAERAPGINPKSNIRGASIRRFPLHLKSTPAILRMQALTPIEQPEVKAQAYGRFRYKLRKSS